jgi:SP family general alpha glucoside:H+ symporter-like MFS transporter
MKYLPSRGRRNGAASISPIEFINHDGDDGSYDVDLAIAAEASEKDMTFKDARKADLRLIWYSLGFSGTIIMEGYGLALITYLFSFSEFNKKFGRFEEAQNAWEVRYSRLWLVCWLC